jgi:DNA-binding CsgD family transcriptional regulator
MEGLRMEIEVERLFAAFGRLVGRADLSDLEFGDIFREMMRSLVHFDHIVVFAYKGDQPPRSLYTTFGPEDRAVFVTLYQRGPYLLDPFYHNARARNGGLFQMRQLAPDRFFSSEYYRTFYIKTALAEEVGFFVPVEDEVTVVLSLMRREQSGAFSSAEYGRLLKVEPLVSILVRQYWGKLAHRFTTSASRTRRRRTNGASATNTIWKNLKLSAREAAIVELVLQGHSSESIGLKLGITTGTVKVHRRNIYLKLGISSQTQLLSIYLKSITDERS